MCVCVGGCGCFYIFVCKRVGVHMGGCTCVWVSDRRTFWSTLSLGDKGLQIESEFECQIWSDSKSDVKLEVRLIFEFN